MTTPLSALRLGLAAFPALLLGAGAVVLWAAGADVAAFVAINRAAAAWSDVLWAIVTDQGSILAAGAMAALFVLRRPRVAAAVLLSWPAGIVVVRGLKAWLAEPRPAALLPPESVHVIGPQLLERSFPSGHAATAFAFVAALLFSIEGRHARRWALPVIAAAALVALSRIAVGAHWPSDVLAGAALGWLCGLGGALWAARWTFWQTRGGVLALGAIGVLAAVLRLAFDYGYAQARPLAWLLGAAALLVSSAAVWQARRRCG